MLERPEVKGHTQLNLSFFFQGNKGLVRVTELSVCMAAQAVWGQPSVLVLLSESLCGTWMDSLQTPSSLMRRGQKKKKHWKKSWLSSSTVLLNLYVFSSSIKTQFIITFSCLISPLYLHVTEMCSPPESESLWDAPSYWEQLQLLSWKEWIHVQSRVHFT